MDYLCKGDGRVLRRGGQLTGRSSADRRVGDGTGNPGADSPRKLPPGPRDSGRYGADPRPGAYVLVGAAGTRASRPFAKPGAAVATSRIRKLRIHHRPSIEKSERG